MNRELKFKLVKDNQLLGIVELEPNGLIDPCYDWDTAYEYTGMKDKNGNGREIYEGDIVRAIAADSEDNAHWHEEDGAYPVCWDNSGCAYQVNGLPLTWYGSLEVIGSAYENPELLPGTESV